MAAVGDGLAALVDRLAAVEDRLTAIERTAADARRRQRVADLRQDPARHLSGIAEARRVVPEDLDELSDVMARWNVPLTPEERSELVRAAMVAQAIVGTHGTKVHMVVDVVTTASVPSLDTAASRARIFTSRNRRAIPVLLMLERPAHEIVTEAARRGVELVVDQ